MGNLAGVRRDFAALEERRMEAARLLRRGLGQSEVARELGVHRQSVSRWARELERWGVRGLRKARRTGRPPKLSPAQLRDLERALMRGPEALGFQIGLWSASRVRDLIEYRPECATTRPTSGASCASSTGPASGRAGERWSATSKRSGTGRSTAGPRLKKTPLRAAPHRLHRRERIERTAASGPDLGAARADPGAAVSLQLEDAFGRRRHYLVEFLLPALPRHHPCPAGCRLPWPSPAPPAGQAPGGLGRPAAASRAAGHGLYPRAAGPTRHR